MQLYCPRCGNGAPQGQRFCRACGMKLDVIVDAMEGRATPIDVERVKANLLEFGLSLRDGYEKLSQNIKPTNPLPNAPPWQANSISNPPPPSLPSATERELRKTIKALRQTINKIKAAHSRKHSLQQATLKLLQSGALTGVWFYLLTTARRAGTLEMMVQTLGRKLELPAPELLTPVIGQLWIFALIPAAVGLAHLINGIFFAPSTAELAAEEPLELVDLPPNPWQPIATPFSVTEAPAYQAMPATPAVAANPVITSSLVKQQQPPQATGAAQGFPASVTEDETKRFQERASTPAQTP